MVYLCRPSFVAAKEYREVYECIAELPMTLHNPDELFQVGVPHLFWGAIVYAE